MARIIVALVLILAIAGGGFWYWTTTPQYSLEQLKDAVVEHNLSKFQMYFSTDQVADSMVKDLLASPLRKTLGGEYLERILSGGMVSESTVRHEVASGIANDVKTLVETGSFPTQEGPGADKVSMGALDQRLGIRTLSLKKLQEIKVNGNTATVSMLLRNAKFDADIEMVGELQNKDGYWQATRIINIVEFFQKLFELEKSKTSPLKSTTIRNPPNVKYSCCVSMSS